MTLSPSSVKVLWATPRHREPLLWCPATVNAPSFVPRSQIQARSRKTAALSSTAVTVSGVLQFPKSHWKPRQMFQSVLLPLISDHHLLCWSHNSYQNVLRSAVTDGLGQAGAFFTVLFFQKLGWAAGYPRYNHHEVDSLTLCILRGKETGKTLNVLNEASLL